MPASKRSGIECDFNAGIWSADSFNCDSDVRSIENGKICKPKREYVRESHLIDEFCSAVHFGFSPWKVKSILREYNFGWTKPDVLIVSSSNTLISVEAKLSDWRKVVRQACRATVFASSSYILMPYDKAVGIKEERRNELISKNIGLCVVSGASVRVVIRPSKSISFHNGLSGEIKKEIKSTFERSA